MLKHEKYAHIRIIYINKLIFVIFVWVVSPYFVSFSLLRFFRISEMKCFPFFYRVCVFFFLIHFCLLNHWCRDTNTTFVQIHTFCQVWIFHRCRMQTHLICSTFVCNFSGRKGVIHIYMQMGARSALDPKTISHLAIHFPWGFANLRTFLHPPNRQTLRHQLRHQLAHFTHQLN